MTDANSNQNPLPYVTQPLVGRVAIHRGPGSIAITLNPDSRALLKSIVVFLLWLCIPAVVLWNSWNNHLDLSFDLGTRIFVTAISVTIGITQFIGKILYFANPVRLELTASGLRLICRKLNSVPQAFYPTYLIADVYSEKLRLPRHLFRENWASLRLIDCRDAALLRGSPAELKCIVDGLRGALNIGPDPLHAQLYPPPPKDFRGRLRLGPMGAALDFPVRRLQLSVAAALVVAVPLFVTLELLPEQWCGNQLPPGGWLTFMVIALFTGGVAAAVAAALADLMRSTSLGASPQAMSLIENGLVRPYRGEWKSNDIAEVRPVMSINGKRRRALMITLKSGETIPCLFGERLADIEWVATCIRIAQSLQRIKPAAPKHDSQ